MLRRVARALRNGLLLLGLALLAWLPFSSFFYAQLQLSLAEVCVGAMTRDDYFFLYVEYLDFRTSSFEAGSLPYGPPSEDRLQDHLVPSWYWYHSVKLWSWIQLPLWLLAFLCLAWPVTSFLVRRRRRGRGFEVGVGMTNEETRSE